jgi:hypothetical protein
MAGASTVELGKIFPKQLFPETTIAGMEAAPNVSQKKIRHQNILPAMRLQRRFPLKS